MEALLSGSMCVCTGGGQAGALLPLRVCTHLVGSRAGVSHLAGDGLWVHWGRSGVPGLAELTMSAYMLGQQWGGVCVPAAQGRGPVSVWVTRQEGGRFGHRRREGL